MIHPVLHHRHHAGRPHAEPGFRWNAAGNGDPLGLQRFFAGFESFQETPLLDLPQLAAASGVSRVIVKDESERMELGAFKALGGIFAVAAAVSRVTGLPLQQLLTGTSPAAAKLTVVCASAGNHGLAVAEGARLLGVPALILVSEDVSVERRERITARGAKVHGVPGTYDDAVRIAGELAARPGYLLVADTAADPADQGVLDVMQGYTLLAHEITAQLARSPFQGARPTHLFLQAGVGGIAATLAGKLGQQLTADGRIVIVEPVEADCLRTSLQAGAPTPARGNLQTSMSMLACGEVSLPAFEVLQRVATDTLAISDTTAENTVTALEQAGGPSSTPSGVAGLAGFRAAAADPDWRQALGLTEGSIVLCVITEGA